MSVLAELAAVELERAIAGLRALWIQLKATHACRCAAPSARSC
jgi:hypothetical protein